MTTVIILERLSTLAQGHPTGYSIFGHFSRLAMTSPIQFEPGPVCCFSLIFSKLCDHLAFAFCRPFTGSTKRERGISPQEKPSFGFLKKAEV